MFSSCDDPVDWLLGSCPYAHFRPTVLYPADVWWGDETARLHHSGSWGVGARGAASPPRAEAVKLVLRLLEVRHLIYNHKTSQKMENGNNGDFLIPLSFYLLFKRKFYVYPLVGEKRIRSNLFCKRIKWTFLCMDEVGCRGSVYTVLYCRL